MSTDCPGGDESCEICVIWEAGNPTACRCGAKPGAEAIWHAPHCPAVRHWDLCPHGVNCVHAPQVDDGRRGA